MKWFIGILSSILIFFVAISYAGTNTLTSVSSGKVQTSHVNQFYTALNQGLNPRNSSGVVTDLGGSLGQSSTRWDNAYIKTLVLGASADSISLDDNATQLRIKVGGNTIWNIPSTGASFVTNTNRSALGQQVGTSTSTFSTTSASYVDVTNMSVTFTTVGRPVMLLIQADSGSGNDARFTQGAGGECQIQFLRDGSAISNTIGMAATSAQGPPTYSYVDTGASAASHTWKVQARSGGGGGVNACGVAYMVLVGYEL